MKELNRLHIKEISNSTVVFEDGSMVAVLAVQPSLKKLDAKDKKRQIANYRVWLSSLDYPVQIIGRTVNIDVEDRLMIFKAQNENFIRKKKEHSETYMDFKKFYKWFEKEAPKKVKRLYYIVIPFLPKYKSRRDLKKMTNLRYYISQLDERCLISKKLLESCNLKINRLSNDELIKLYSSYFIFSFYNKKYLTVSDYVMEWGQRK